MQLLFIEENLNMNCQFNSKITIGRLVTTYVLTILAGVCLVSGVATGAEQISSGTVKQADIQKELEDHKYSDRFTIILDPAAKQQLGEDTYKEILEFFDTAEDAIDTKDVKALMETYSENYKDGDKDNKFIAEIWTKIFARFNRLVIHHNLKLVTVSADKHLVILRSGGLLLAESDSKRGLVTVDNWSNQDLLLINESGKWKLIDTFGEERKRLWFDKPMHPLF